jgi:WD40 repeat protein
MEDKIVKVWTLVNGKNRLIYRGHTGPVIAAAWSPNGDYIAGFLSRTLLVRHKQFEGCPTFAFEQSREGFRSFVDRIRS